MSLGLRKEARGPCDLGGPARLFITGNTLQDVRLLASGKTPQRAGEVERDLDKADGMIRLLFNDVQTLKDGRHPQGEQMYRRWGPDVSAPSGLGW